MGGGGGLGLFSGTSGSGGKDAFSGGTLVAAAQSWSMTDAGGLSRLAKPADTIVPHSPANDNDGNIYQRELGVYRGIQPAYHRTDPVIFIHDAKQPHRIIGLLSGTLTNEKGLWGTIASGSQNQGQTRFIVYGDPKTGQPSSWTLLQWTGTGKKQPNTDIEIFEWRQVQNATSAIQKKGFNESYEKFKQSQNVKTDKQK